MRLRLLLILLMAFTFTACTGKQSSNTSATPIPVQKDYTYVDSQKFGYSVQLPDTWNTKPWEGGDLTDAEGLSRNFFAKSCGEKKENRISIVHFETTQTDKKILQFSDLHKKQGFTVNALLLPSGKGIDIWSGKVGDRTDSYAYIPNSRGYYKIYYREDCPSLENKRDFEQMLGNLKLQQ